MIGLIKTLLILFFIYFIWKIFRFLFIPLFFSRYVNREQGFSQHNNQRSEGDVTINYNSQKTTKKVDKNVGEYVNYEEVEE